MTAPQPCSLCARPEADHNDAACSFGWTPPIGPVVLCCGSRDFTDRATVLAFTASIMRDGRLSRTGDMLRRCVEAGVVATVVPPGRGPR